MGLLDDAIREHLELKRLHGANPSDVARQEHEALGPVVYPADTAGEHAEEDDEPRVDKPKDQGDGAFTNERRLMDGRGHSDIGQETAELDMQMVLDAETSNSIRAARSDAIDERPSDGSSDPDDLAEESFDWETPD
jgi:hypothetical protein